ncbi:MAG: alpha/beta hydrolase, partial [Gammaproteobacteria bacterium]|nr:alpha/beta hydrolase [Gammaproteobacteria bacterium]
IWPSVPPNAIVVDNQERVDVCWEVNCVYDVSEPTLTFYPAEGDNSGVTVVIMAGGGYAVEAIFHEGHDVAKYLAENGVNAAVLKYRIPSPLRSTKPWLDPLLDLREALARIHDMADNFGLNPDAIGVMGFSAGSHLATTASVFHSELDTENPDFSMLIYGVTRMNDENILWLEESLFHRKMSPIEIDNYRFLDRVNDATPPAFLVHAMDDDVCHYHESLLYHEALTAQGVSSEMHLFQEGGHGFGLGREEDGTDRWPILALAWLRQFEE